MPRDVPSKKARMIGDPRKILDRVGERLARVEAGTEAD
jgi:hypothetical protein